MIGPSSSYISVVGNAPHQQAAPTTTRVQKKAVNPLSLYTGMCPEGALGPLKRGPGTSSSSSNCSSNNPPRNEVAANDGAGNAKLRKSPPTKVAAHPASDPSKCFTLYLKKKKKKNVYIKLAEAVSMRCEEKLRGRSEYPITNTDMVHSP
jgi:hypothetical protein